MIVPSAVFKNFDSDGDGYLSMREFQRAFRALGLKKRSGEKMNVDLAMFNSFDVRPQPWPQRTIRPRRQSNHLSLTH